jgi:class 3 adenylate cyclase
MTTTRRLTAILAADVAGYSSLMGADEEGTHERFKAHLRELIEPKIAEHHGRIVKNTGDGFLAEFASVVDAVRCAVNAQRGMAKRNTPTPPERRQLRNPLYAGIFSGKLPPKFRIANATAPANSCAHTELTGATGPANSCGIGLETAAILEKPIPRIPRPP